MPKTADLVSKEWLLSRLRADSGQLVLLDCRSSNEYGESHIRDAVNFSIPSIMLRRLAAGKIDLLSTIKSRELKTKISTAYAENLFVLYNDLAHLQQQPETTLGVLLRRLTQDGCRVVCLEDGFSRFRNTYPEWCDSCSELLEPPATGMPQVPLGSPDQLPLMGLRSLRISTNTTRSHIPYGSAANSSTESSDTDDRCDSSLGLEEEFPVEILPYLYLGNAANSEDSQALARHSIQYVLNVTPDLPNVFEDLGNIKYMQIPITDHWSQNLASHFPSAIEFIDEARSNNKGILVHCLAGISRSVTITVAYLMYKCSLNLNDAFNLVRSRKADIAPNFHFMEQLHNFERELKLDVSSQNPSVLIEQLGKKGSGGGGGGGGVGGGGQGMQHQGTGKGEKKRPAACCQQCSEGGECKCTSRTDFLSPLASIGVSPDSGIEFDRWGSGTPGE